jgi:hypothetical protein
VTAYIDMINLPESGVRLRPAFIRELYGFYRQWGKELFTQTVQRAFTYKVNSLDMLSRIATQIVKTIICEDIPCIEAEDDYLKRPAYNDQPIKKVGFPMKTTTIISNLLQKRSDIWTKQLIRSYSIWD